MMQRQAEEIVKVHLVPRIVTLLIRNFPPTYIYNPQLLVSGPPVGLTGDYY